MERVLEYIKIAAATFIVFAVATFAFNQYKSTLGIQTATTEKQIEYGSRVEDNYVTSYDGLVVLGSEAVNFIKKHRDKGIATVVTPTDGGVGIPYTLNCTYNQTEGSITALSIELADIENRLDGLRDKSSTFYVNPLTQYKCKVFWAETGVVIGIVFTGVAP